jgi:hypothetical protein
MASPPPERTGVFDIPDGRQPAGAIAAEAAAALGLREDSGAYNGVDAIPAGWRTTVEQADLLVETTAAIVAFASFRA